MRLGSLLAVASVLTSAAGHLRAEIDPSRLSEATVAVFAEVCFESDREKQEALLRDGGFSVLPMLRARTFLMGHLGKVWSHASADYPITIVTRANESSCSAIAPQVDVAAAERALEQVLALATRSGALTADLIGRRTTPSMSGGTGTTLHYEVSSRGLPGRTLQILLSAWPAGMDGVALEVNVRSRGSIRGSR